MVFIIALRKKEDHSKEKNLVAVVVDKKDDAVATHDLNNAEDN